MPALGINATWGAEEWATYVLEHLAVESALLRGGARFIPITGRQAHVPRTLTDGTAAWVPEGTEIPSSAPTGDELVLTPKKAANVVVLSRESVEDAPINELDAVGQALTRSVATALDLVAFSANAGTATTPAGLLSLALPAQTGGVANLDSYIRAQGTIQAIGGLPTVVYVNPTDLTALRLLKDSTGRGLLEPDAQALGAQRAGGSLFIPTAALAAGTALVADPGQIVVGVRRDVEVAFSTDARFTADSIAARVTARLDLGVGDIRGLVKVTTP